MLSLCALYILTVPLFTVVYGIRFGPNPSLLNKCKAEREEPWSYRGLNGPRFWGIRYPTCYGLQQSPIAIVSANAVKDENLAQLILNNYDQPITQAEIENNGHSVEVVPGDGIRRTINVNREEYSLIQFHFHWGDKNDTGSEHTLDGIQYAMEMHLVHTTEDGKIAVVGIFFKQQDNDNEELQKLVDNFSAIKYKGDATELQSNLNLNKLLPSNPTSFYRYQGSLTTPACTEGVTWSVVPDSIPVGKAQMEQFRQLYSVEKEKATESCKLVNNYRPVQLLLGRQVFLSQ